MKPRWLLPLLLPVLALSGCSQVQQRGAESPELAQAYAARESQLRTLASWQLVGRLAVSNGRDGGSGRLTWTQSGDALGMAFSGTMGNSAWRLQADRSGARLETADGSVYLADTVEGLMQSRIGWSFPSDALLWWVRGMAWPGSRERRRLDAEGRLQSLDQSGWQVEFRQYRQTEGLWLPSRLEARRGENFLKLAVKEWRLGEAPGSID